MEKQLNVFIHGETDWLSLAFKHDSLTQLSRINVGKNELSYQIGCGLDGNVLSPLNQQRQESLVRVIATYVSKLDAFKIATETGLDYIFITSFRSSKEGPKEYITRVAGIASLQNDWLTSQGLDKNQGEKILLLETMKNNPLYLNDQYASSSTYHEIMRWGSQSNQSLNN